MRLDIIVGNGAARACIDATCAEFTVGHRPACADINTAFRART